MNKKLQFCFLFLVFVSVTSHSQDERIVPPQEIPAQNFIKFNRFLMNPTFSYVRQENSQLSLYSRNQWVQFDDAPTSYLLSYSSKVNDNIGLGVGIQQQSNGILNYFGANVNYSYGIRLGEKTRFTLGTNLSFFNSGIKGSAITIDADPLIANFQEARILSFKPGVNLTAGRFDVGFYSENLFSYDLRSDQETDGPQVFSGHVMYTQPIRGENFLRIMGRGRRNENGDTVLSGNLLLDMPKLGWVQGGFDDFYGGSIGLGVNLSKHFSIGYVLEKGLTGTTNNLGVTHELTIAYTFNEVTNESILVDNLSMANDSTNIKNTSTKTQKAFKKELDTTIVAVALQNSDTKTSTAQEQTTTQSDRTQDENLKKLEIAMGKARTITSSTTRANNKTTSSKIQEDQSSKSKSIAQPAAIINEQRQNALNVNKGKEKPLFNSIPHSDIQPGYYLVGNIFRNSNYAQRFYEKLKTNGFEESIYLRKVHKNLNYIAMARYNTYSEVITAYNSNMNGRYTDMMSILEVRPEGIGTTVPASNDYTNYAFAKAKTNQPSTAFKKPLEINDHVNIDNQDIQHYELALLPDGTYKLLYNSYTDANATQMAVDSLASRGFNDVETYLDKESDQYYLLYGSFRDGKTAIARASSILQKDVKLSAQSVLMVDGLNQVSFSQKNSPLTEAIRNESAAVAQKSRVKTVLQQQTMDGADKGYYIVANVYRTNYHYKRFLATLESRGLDPKTLYNPLNKYKYVYLYHTDTFEEALKSYESHLNGSYKEEIWILKIE